MKHLSALAALLFAAASASAALPFVPTSISDGKFADDTKWYSLRITSSAFPIGADELDKGITLNTTKPNYSDAYMWCFVGTETDGFQIYNRALGTAGSLAAPSKPDDAQFGANGETAAALVAAPGKDGYTYLWDFAESKNLSSPSSYVSIHGNAAYALNKRGSYLAFWTAGKDHGSSITINPCVEPSINNNVVTLGDGITLACDGGTATLLADGGLSLSAGTWTFTTPEGKVVGNLTYTDADGNTKSFSGYPYTEQTITVEGPAELHSIFVDLSNIIVCESGYPVFIFNGVAPYSIAYRIPSITTVGNGAHKGRLIAVNDYRHCGSDIGYGRIDLHISISDDHGLTWSEPDNLYDADGNPVAMGTGQGKSNDITNLDCGFGDPALVADRESDEVFMVACSGYTSIQSSTAESPQPSARWWSKDGGNTWSKADFSQWEQIYGLFKEGCKFGPLAAQFIGSGRMIQSRKIKVGDYYRIYAVNFARHTNGTICNWVLYSDDFGHNWNVLGGLDQPGVDSSGNEPKCEELPDGSLLLAARSSGQNRNFNVFRYTDVEKGLGSWDLFVNTDMGFGQNINSCNGEIMILPVKEKATGALHYLALQSYTNSTSREKVSIAWKALKDPSDYDGSQAFTKWGGVYQVSKIGSAYSTMTFTGDNKVGFLYEEETFGKSYTEIYRSLSIEELTGDKYEYADDSDGKIAARMAREMMEHRANIPAGKYVGQFAPSQEQSAALKAIIDGYEANPSLESIAQFNVLISQAVNMPAEGVVYTFRSARDSYNTDRYMYVGANKKVGSTTKVTETAKFTLSKAETEGQWYIYNTNYGLWLASTHTDIEKPMYAVPDKADAAPFTFESDPNTGLTAIVCVTPGNTSYPAMHLKSTGGNVVIWNKSDVGSKWYMSALDEEPKDPEQSSIQAVEPTATPTAYFDLRGRKVAIPVKGQLYITNKHEKIKY